MKWIKLLHITFVVLTFLSFAMRGRWMLSGSPMLNKKWVRIFPHIIDSGLLASGITLVYLMSLHIMETEWLFAKIVALLFYIAFGTLALKRGRTRTVRIIFFSLALVTFAYIVFVAVSKSPKILF